MNRSLLSEASYRALEADTLLKNGVGTTYGLGVDVEMEKQRRKISHGGEVMGFTAVNNVYPDDRAANVVLVNQDASRATDNIAEKLSEIVFDQAQATDEAKAAQAKAIYEGLQQGRLDRGLFTADANFYFSQQAIDDFKASLAPLGSPTEFKQTRSWLRGGMTGRSYDAKDDDRTLRVWTYEMPDGKLAQQQVQHPPPPVALHPDDLPLWEAQGGAPFFGMRIDPGPRPSISLSHAQLLRFGENTFEVRHAPGHTPGHVVFYCAAEKLVILWRCHLYERPWAQRSARR